MRCAARLGVTPEGVETCANSRRMEKGLRLQSADLLPEYNLYEGDLARPTVKIANFHGKEAHLKFRARDHQPATRCSLVMTSNIESTGWIFQAQHTVHLCYLSAVSRPTSTCVSGLLEPGIA